MLHHSTAGYGKKGIVWAQRQNRRTTPLCSDRTSSRVPSLRGIPSLRSSAAEALIWQVGGRARQQRSGLLLHDALRDVALLGTPAGAVAFKIQLRVVRSIETGLLDFYYRILTGACPLCGPAHTIFYWLPPPVGIEVTLADFRSEGLSRTAPDSFFYGPPVNKYGFTFSKGIPANSYTPFFFVSTNAREFSACAGELWDAYLPGTTTTLKVPGPVPDRYAAA
jgi:hypothetical protein